MPNDTHHYGDRRRAPGFHALRATVGVYARVDNAAWRVRQGLSNTVEGVLQHALRADERANLTVYLYSLQTRVPARTSLFGWEESWYRRALPSPPARVLVGAAGGGREVTALRARGYRVDAFEPVATLEAALAVAVSDSGDALCGSYEQLIEAVLRGEQSPLSPLAGRRYDAIVLGWGSLTHVIDPDTRSALLESCDRLCPEGPILASFYMSDDRRAAHRSRGLDLGRRIGLALAHLRGLRPPARGEGIECFTAQLGFFCRFTVTDLQDLASQTGRRVEIEQSGFPHASFAKTR